MNRFELLMTILLMTLSVGATAGELEYFGGISFGNVTLEKSSSEIEKALEQSTWPGSSVDVGDVGSIVKVFGGVFLSRGLGVRIGWTDLGQADLTVKSGVPAGQEEEFANDALDALPTTGTGLSLAVQGRFPISDHLMVHDWAGLFFWSSDQAISLNASGATVSVKRSNTGTDLMLGAALEYLIGDQLGVRIEAERYNQDNDGVTLFGVGAAYYF